MGLIVIFLWTVFNGFIFLIGFKLTGHLRISEEEEIKGSDYFKTGGYILNYDDVTLKHYADLFFKFMGGNREEQLPTPRNEKEVDHVNLELNDMKAEQQIKENAYRKKTNEVLKTSEIPK
jgi:hypothetical protein